MKNIKKFDEFHLVNEDFDTKRRDYSYKAPAFRLVPPQKMYTQIGEDVEELVEKMMKIYDINRISALNNISVLTEHIIKEDNRKKYRSNEKY
jgi:hypothetical protein